MADTTTQPANCGKVARAAASVLWVLVLIALAYGVYNTAKAAVELFL